MDEKKVNLPNETGEKKTSAPPIKPSAPPMKKKVGSNSQPQNKKRPDEKKNNKKKKNENKKKVGKIKFLTKKQMLLRKKKKLWQKKKILTICLNTQLKLSIKQLMKLSKVTFRLALLKVDNMYLAIFAHIKTARDVLMQKFVNIQRR